MTWLDDFVRGLMEGKMGGIYRFGKDLDLRRENVFFLLGAGGSIGK